MISERGGFKELRIFDFFEIDRNLLKYKKEENDNKILLSDSSDESSNWVNVSPVGGFSNKFNSKHNWFIRIMNWLFHRKDEYKKTITVIEFFSKFASSYKELTPIGEIAEHYEKAIAQAIEMGQTTLLESLKKIIDIARGEAHLIVMGLKKYVTEKQVIGFYENVGREKNLKLTWIKNFNRIIPEEVYKIKKELDTRKIFDNYVILHYDPKDNGVKLTKNEIEKKKDPILFGVIKDSRKLYYVADWKDEFCDLTLEEMFKTLKDKILEINNKTVKTFIDKTKA